MTRMQKLIKYLAIALAILLIAAIVSGICGAVAGIFHFLYRDKNVSHEIVSSVETSGEAKNLDIDILTAELIIKEGNSLKAETESEYIDCYFNGDMLTVKEKRFDFLSSKHSGKVTVYIPKDTLFDKASIETGAGSVTIDTLSAKKLELEMGAGEVKIDNLTALENSDIDCGAGEVTVSGGALANLELDHGVGEVNLTSKLSGSCEIDLGMGEANLGFIGDEDDYSIMLDKGIGEAKINGMSMRVNTVYGAGECRVRIDGGAGKINLKFITAF